MEDWPMEPSTWDCQGRLILTIPVEASLRAHSHRSALEDFVEYLNDLADQARSYFDGDDWEQGLPVVLWDASPRDITRGED